MKPMLLLVSAIVLVLILLLRARIMVGAFNNNIAFALLNSALSSPAEARKLARARRAEAFFTRAARVDSPIRLFTSRGLGLSFGLQDDLERAQQALDSLGTMSAATNYTLLGDAAVNLHRQERAEYWYERAVSVDPGHFPAWVKMGSVYEQNGDLAQALAAYETVWNDAPELAFKPYVSVLMTLNETAKAREILDFALRNHLDVSDRVWGWRTLAQLSQDEGQLNAALDTYAAGMEEFPSNAALMVGMGWLLYEEEQDGRMAQSLFERAIAAEPGSGIGYFAMGELMAKQADYSAADAWFATALEKQDSNSRWRLVRANTSRSAGNYDLAVAQYEDTIDQYPAYAPPYYELAETYRLLNAPEQAVQVLDRAVELPATPPIRYYLLAADIYDWGGQKDRAVAICEKVLTLDPGNSQARERLMQLQE